MMVSLTPPSAADTRSTYADWLEFQTLINPTGRVTMTPLVSVLEIADDMIEASAAAGAKFDEAIAETSKDYLAGITFDELDYRQKALGSDYPFELRKGGTLGPSLSLRKDWRDQEGSVIYVFCLIVSAIRAGKFQPRDKLKSLENRIGNTFQICACMAAGGYLGGDVSSFGFPRANGLGFLPALKAVYKRFGAGHVRDRIEEGMPDDLKDGGIDVIAWRDHPDRMPGKLYLVGQSASGSKWRDKSVIEYVDQMHTGWFTHAPQKHAVPAMFIPFTFHADLDEPREVSFLEKLKTRFWYDEQHYGIIFDRLRITHFASVCLNMAEDGKKKIDGALLYEAIKSWVDEATEATGMAKAVAA